MSDWVKRIGQVVTGNMPAYRLEQELENYFLVEYCNVWKLLPKSQYEVMKPEAPHG